MIESFEQERGRSKIRGDILGHGGKTVAEVTDCNPIDISAKLNPLSNIPVVASHLEPSAINLIPWCTAHSEDAEI